MKMAFFGDSLNDGQMHYLFIGNGKKYEKNQDLRNGSFSPLARIKFRLMDKSKRLGRELERAGK